MHQDGVWQAAAVLKILRGWTQLSYFGRNFVEVKVFTDEARNAPENF